MAPNREGGGFTSRLRILVPGALGVRACVRRMKTQEAHVLAIRSLQARASEEAPRYFEIEPDGSFTLHAMLRRAEAV
jgi:hypothetical protein